MDGLMIIIMIMKHCASCKWYWWFQFRGIGWSFIVGFNKNDIITSLRYIYTSIINKSSLCGQISKRVNWWTIRDSQQFCPIWIKGRTCSSAASLFFTQTLVSNPQGSQDLGRLQSQATWKGGRRAGSDWHYPPFGTEQVDANRNVKCGTIHKAVCGYSP